MHHNRQFNDSKKISDVQDKKKLFNQVYIYYVLCRVRKIIGIKKNIYAVNKIYSWSL